MTTKISAAIQCQCSAIVGIGTRWVYGRHAEGTMGGFIVHGTIPIGRCPICRGQLKTGLWFWN